MKRIFISIWVALLLLVGCKKDNSLNPKSKGQSGSITRFTVYGDYMYALDQNKILTYSLANASDPALVNELIIEYGLETITIYEGTGYVGSRNALYILDIDNPALPKIASQAQRSESLLGSCDPVVIKGNYAYSTVKVIENICGQVAVSSQLLTYDVSDKYHPVLTDSIAMNQPNGLGYTGNYLFVCDIGVNRVQVFDIANPAKPQAFSAFNLQQPIDVIAEGNRLVVSTVTGFAFYDVSDINNIKQVGSILFQ